MAPDLSHLKDKTVISGVGESEYNQGGGKIINNLVYDACENAIADAGLKPDDIDGMIVDKHYGSETVTPGELAEVFGFEHEFSHYIGGAGGAANVGSPLFAAMAIEEGLADHVLCYFGTDYASQREAQGSEDGGPYAFHMKSDNKRNFEVPFGWVTQPVYFAGHGRRHMYECGTTEEQVGELVIQQRQNALANDKALKKEPLTLDDYLNDPKIADPYRTLDCGLITDGAGAYIVSSADYASSSPHDPVYVKGIGRGLDARLQESWITQHDPYTSIPADKSGPRAFEMAGVSPDDVDFAELYDCFSTIPFIQLENLGFCEKGQSGDFVENKGITVEDGELPINTHGGLLSQAYIMGMNHVIEGVRQIRGTADNQVEDADLGVVTGWGSNEHSTLILAGEEEQ